MFRLDGDHVQVGTTQGFKGTSRQVGKDGDDSDDVDDSDDGGDGDDGDGDHVQVGTTQGFKRTFRQVGKKTNITPKYLSIQSKSLVVSCLGHRSLVDSGYSFWKLRCPNESIRKPESQGARIS